MSVINFKIEDGENGSVRVSVTPSIQDLIIKAHKDNVTAAEGLAMHLARKALEYSQAQAAKDSKIIIPKIKT